MRRLFDCARAGVAGAFLASAATAFAAHPLQAEDTGTQGVRNVEIEFALARSHLAGDRSLSFQPQLSWGLSPALDLIVQPAWVENRPAGSSATRGIGDTTLDLKWRLLEAGPWSFGLRGGFTLATARRDLGLPHGTTAAHITGMATLDATPFALHANAGYTRNPRVDGLRREAGRVAGALTWTRERLTLAAEAGADSNPDPARTGWVKTWLVGAVYTVAPGLDADIGYQWASPAPQPRSWLLGLTWRFAR